MLLGPIRIISDHRAAIAGALIEYLGHRPEYGIEILSRVQTTFPEVKALQDLIPTLFKRGNIIYKRSGSQEVAVRSVLRAPHSTVRLISGQPMTGVRPTIESLNSQKVLPSHTAFVEPDLRTTQYTVPVASAVDEDLLTLASLAVSAATRSFAVDTLTGYAASKIGDAYANETLDPVNHKIVHGIVGGIGGMILSPDDPQRSFTSGFTGAATTEFFADLLQQDTQRTVRQIIEEGRTQHLTQEEIRGNVELYIQHQGEIARFIGATAAFALNQDVGVAATTGGIAVENNWSKMMIAFYVANIGLTAHQAYTAYEEEGIEAAAFQVAMGGLLGYAGGQVFGVAIKGAAKIIPLSQIKAAWTYILSQNPALAKSLGYVYRTFTQAVARGDIVLDKAAQRVFGRVMSRFRSAPMDRISDGTIKGFIHRESSSSTILHIPEVWTKGPVTREEIIEQAMGHNLHKNFPVIDKLENRIATSIKSIDLTSPTYHNTNRLRYTLTKYVDKVARFKNEKLAKREIKYGIDFDKRALELVVPKQFSHEQFKILQDVTTYARSQGVSMKLFIVR